MLTAIITQRGFPER